MSKLQEIREPEGHETAVPAAFWLVLIFIMVAAIALAAFVGRQRGYRAGLLAAAPASADSLAFVRLSEEAAAARAELDRLVLSACQLLAASDTNRQDAEP